MAVMIKWICRVFGGGSNEPENNAKKSDIDLSQEGYSPKYAESRVRELRGKLIELREHSDVITRTGADKPSGEIALLVSKVCTSVEKVLQNLKRDPNDFARTGLSLESIDPLNELMQKCAKFAATGITGAPLQKELDKAKEALTLIGKRFDDLLKGLQVDDQIGTAGLKATIEQLSNK
jgi:hypothetical protein